MQTIEVKRVIHAPIEKVFDLLSDHEGYRHFPGVRDAVLVKKGKRSKNGVGAVREIDAGIAWFREEITAYERPTRLDYKITASRPPLEHEGASVQLKETSQGTEVTWRSTLRIRIPLIGGLLTRLAVPQLAKAFASTLKDAERRLVKPA